MRTRSRTIETSFGPETRFSLRTLNPEAALRIERENQLEALKRELLSERLADIWDVEANATFRRAANEAAALAWTTAYPLLVFPALFEEKATTSMEVAERQREITVRSRELLAV